jgi:hypothetical protein
MDYELGKKLKDAGFPQPEMPEVGREYFDEDGGIHVFSEEEWDATNIPVETSAENRREKKRLLSEYNNGCLIPTLEELIEACGEQFSKLKRGRGGETWVAQWFKGGTSDDVIAEIGSTPTEAVARLWLALHTKAV